MTLRVIQAKDLLALPVSPRAYLLDPWLPEGGLAFIYAKAGVGKTHLGLAVAKAVACGEDLLGWKTGEPRRVLYVDGEMHKAELLQRVQTLLAGEKPDRLAFAAADFQPGRMPSLSTAEGQKAFLEAAKDYDLVIFDNLACLTSSGDENDVTIWRSIQALFLDLKRQGKSIILFHHAGKGGDQRGTSARADAMDTVIQLEEPDDHDPSAGATFEVHFIKHRGFYGSATVPFVASLDPVTGYFSRKPMSASVDLATMMEMRAGGATMKAIGEAVGLDKSNVSRRLKAVALALRVAEPKAAQPATSGSETPFDIAEAAEAPVHGDDPPAGIGLEPDPFAGSSPV